MIVVCPKCYKAMHHKKDEINKIIKCVCLECFDFFCFPVDENDITKMKEHINTDVCNRCHGNRGWYQPKMREPGESGEAEFIECPDCVDKIKEPITVEKSEHNRLKRLDENVQNKIKELRRCIPDHAGLSRTQMGFLEKIEFLESLCK
jgi:DNA-directed RNA polymerase subunit M/transcription elongation factor TFIIS